MDATRPGSKRLLRDLNRLLALRLVVEAGPLSRTEIARRAGLNASTVTTIMGDFLTAGLVREQPVSAATAATPREDPRRGRTPVLVEVAPHAGVLVGIKLRDADATVVVCDLTCGVRHVRTAPVDAMGDPARAAGMLADAVRTALAEAGADPARLLGVGVGVPGTVDTARRTVLHSPILDWHDVPLGAWLAERLHTTVLVDNVVNCLAVGERRFGAGAEVPDFLVVTVGRGVGLGVVVGGTPQRGTTGAGGDLGHTIVDQSPDAPACTCGQRGCLDAVASDYAVVRAVLGRDPGAAVETHIDDLVRRARDGDARVAALFARAGDALGVAVGNLVRLFDPALVVLTGEGLRAADLLEPPLRARLAAGAGRPVEIALLERGEEDWARGAAAVVLHELLRPPIYAAERRALLIDRLLPA